jgi:HSP20 family protein
MSLDHLKDQLGSFWNSLSEGWRELWQSAANALTRFVPGENTNLPAASEVDDEHFLPTRSWAMLGGELFEDEQRLVVRLELPGMDKQDFDIEIRDRQLRVCGEKRFERESGEGRWRVMQCAYGTFRRIISLPCEVNADDAQASYRNGVLRIELAKRDVGKPQGYKVTVA